MAESDVQRILVELSEIKTIVQRTGADIQDHENRLRCLETKSGKKWDSLTAQIITLIVAAIFGLLAGKYF